MKKRFKMSNRASQRKFRRGARTKTMNIKPRPMRGGTRL